MNSIFTRRSVRKFADKPVEPQKLEKLLRAAMQAPSATNQQPWEFLVITEKEKILKLEKFSKYAKMLKEAPAAIVMLQKTTVDYGQFAQQDMGACVENLLLQAVEEGLGTCWLGVSLNDERAEFIERLFDLPHHPRINNVFHFTPPHIIYRVGLKATLYVY